MLVDVNLKILEADCVTRCTDCSFFKTVDATRTVPVAVVPGDTDITILDAPILDANDILQVTFSTLCILKVKISGVSAQITSPFTGTVVLPPGLYLFAPDTCISTAGETLTVANLNATGTTTVEFYLAGAV